MPNQITSPSRFAFAAAGIAAATAFAAQMPHLQGGAETSSDARLSALVALIGAAVALAFAVRRFTDGNAVVSLCTAGLFAAHPAFAPAVASASARPFVAAVLTFAAAALRRGPFGAAPAWRNDPRRIAETLLYLIAAAVDPRTKVAALLVVATDVWFHPDAPPAWRRSTVRTGVAQIAAATVVGGAVAYVRGVFGAYGGWPAVQGAAGVAWLFDAPSSTSGIGRHVAWVAVAALLIPAGILSRRAAAPKALALALGVLGLWTFVGACGAGAAGAGPTPLAVVGLVFAAPIFAWRLAQATTAPRADDPWSEAPIPSVPALRDVVRAAASEAAGAAESRASETFERAVSAAVREALEAVRSAANRKPDPRWERLLADDVRTAPDDGPARLRRYVRDELAPRLRGARRVLIVGAPPAELVADMAERVEVTLRLEGDGARDADVEAYARLPRVRIEPVGVASNGAAHDAAGADAAADTAARRPTFFDAAFSFRDGEFAHPSDAVRHVAALRRLLRRGAPVALIAVSETDEPGPPAWDDPQEAGA